MLKWSSPAQGVEQPVPGVAALCHRTRAISLQEGLTALAKDLELLGEHESCSKADRISSLENNCQQDVLLRSQVEAAMISMPRLSRELYPGSKDK